MERPGKPKLLGVTKTPTITIPEDQMGPPGTRGILIVIPQMKVQTHTDDQIFGDMTQRLFTISALLSKTPGPRDAPNYIAGDFDAGAGGSFLSTPPNAARMLMQAQEGPFQIDKNAQGELSSVSAVCKAVSESAARSAFMDMVFPFLDHLSYTYNVPIYVTTIRVFDLTYQSAHIEYVSPPRQQTIRDADDRLFSELKPVYSMYREAKNSTSEFYRFLCFHKIMEGLLGSGALRSDVFQRARKIGLELERLREEVPPAENLPPELAAYTGKPMQSFYDQVLTAQFRNALAHLKTDSGVLLLSSATEFYIYAFLAAMMDGCARLLIANHEKLLSQLNAVEKQNVANGATPS